MKFSRHRHFKKNLRQAFINNFALFRSTSFTKLQMASVETGTFKKKV